ncbi:hypothetical protein DLAC_11169 [Tieghemostelium lacteum]|uniref:Uncharacterized protein n=1 Tax=Tieghemostelium lacteum TaxID=361077 RepID=A0A151Z3C9_TIELA|nr:hypothetical protein DLAC_11169 [Tieghemostelium lacteum]|eukprot:KYQ88460.1 hypothetical protein DLAC_11169 [Tieghemostelium lacteum]
MNKSLGDEFSKPWLSDFKFPNRWSTNSLEHPTYLEYDKGLPLNRDIYRPVASLTIQQILYILVLVVLLYIML